MVAPHARRGTLALLTILVTTLVTLPPGSIASEPAQVERLAFDVGGYVRGLALDAAGRLHVTVQCDAGTQVPECADPHAGGLVLRGGSAVVRLAGERPTAVYRDVNDFAGSPPAFVELAAFGCDGTLHVARAGASPVTVWRMDGVDPVAVFETAHLTGFTFDCAGVLGEAGLLYYVGDHVETSTSARDFTIWSVDLSTRARSIVRQIPLPSWGSSNSDYGLAIFEGSLYAAMPSAAGRDGVYRLDAAGRVLVYERANGSGLTSFVLHSEGCVTYLSAMQDAGNNGRVFTTCERPPLTRLLAEDSGLGYATGVGPWGSLHDPTSAPQRGLGWWVAVPGETVLAFDVEGAIRVCLGPPGPNGGIYTPGAICASEGRTSLRAPSGEYYAYLSGSTTVESEFSLRISRAE